MKTHAKLLLLLVPALLWIMALAIQTDAPAAGPSADLERLRARADALHAEGSYALALEVYEELAREDLPPELERWVVLRGADSRWRSASATRNADTTELDRGREALLELMGEARNAEDRDRIWAEAQESLGDFWWVRREGRSWGQAWAHYGKALDWWAGERD